MKSLSALRSTASLLVIAMIMATSVPAEALDEPGGDFLHQEVSAVPFVILGGSLIGVMMIKGPPEPARVMPSETDQIEQMREAETPIRITSVRRPGGKYVYGRILGTDEDRLEIETATESMWLNSSNIKSVQVLEPLAKRARAGRFRWGVFIIGMGLASVTFHATYESTMSTSESESAGVLLGMGFIALGVYQFARTSEPERELDRLIDDD